MPGVSTFAVFVPAALALLVVPGPAVVYIVTRSVDQGRAAGLASVLGIHTGSIVHVAAAALGVSVIIARSAEAFTVVKLAGAAYLVVLGVRRVLGRGEDVGHGTAAVRSRRRVYGEGILVNVLNPKTAVFFLAFLPQFVSPDHSPVAQTLVLGAAFIVLGMLSDGAYALVASSIADRFDLGTRMRRRMERVSGGIYIALGVVAAVARRPAGRVA